MAKTKKIMNVVEAAFNGFKSNESREYKRFVEDLKQAGEDALRVQKNRKLKEAERALEDAEYELEKALKALEEAKKDTSEEAISEAFAAALKNCKSKGAQQTFTDALNALNPKKNEKAIKAAEEVVEKAQKVVDEKKEEVEKNKYIISLIEKTQERLFSEEREVEVEE